MCTYQKIMEGYKLKDLKLKEFDSIQEMFDRAFKRVEDDKETAELKQLMKIVKDEEEVAIDATPLAVKSPIKPWGKSKLKDKKDNSWDLVHVGRVIHHQTHPIGQTHRKNDTLDNEKAQERWDFTLLTLSKEAQAVSITGFAMTGNPSWSYNSIQQPRLDFQ
ncbi:hypothetical protein Tco_0813383 [Tanacetum coccineum]